MGTKVKEAAHTGRPHWASRRLTPSVRRKVVFPDMLLPVTRIRRSCCPITRSLATRCEAGIRGCASRVASTKRVGAGAGAVAVELSYSSAPPAAEVYAPPAAEVYGTG